jgi:Fe-S-cluster containining protein
MGINPAARFPFCGVADYSERSGMKKRANQRAAANRSAPARGHPLTGRDLDARRAERVATSEALRHGRTPLTLIAIADHGTTVAEEAVRQAVQADPPPPSACKEGCDWCCHLTVGTSVPEVVRIVAYLRQLLSPEEFRALRERVLRLDEQRRELKAAHRGEAGLPCALLVNHRCAAYPVRPLTCRGFNSSDASRCERFVQSSGQTTVPLYAPQVRLAALVLDGMGTGLAESGLAGDRLELTAALRIALEVPEAVERFLAGAPAFAAARLD